MKALTCVAARKLLQGYHDGELSVDEQLAVSAHVDWCDDCAAALEDLAVVGALLRTALPGRALAGDDELAALPAIVVSRLRAERTLLLGARVREMFEDLHFVYAGGAAFCAAIVCAVVMLGTMKLVGTIRPHSLAALVGVLTPGSNENPVVARANIQMPKPLDQEFAPLVMMQSDTDAVFALSGTVTREGRVANLALLEADVDQYLGEDVADVRAVAGMLDVMSRARFEPASVDGAPVAVNMVWLVAHTTVRGSARRDDHPTRPPTIGPPTPVSPIGRLRARRPGHV